MTAAYHRDYMRSRRAERRADGECVDCGKRSPSFYRCARCSCREARGQRARTAESGTAKPRTLRVVAELVQRAPVAAQGPTNTTEAQLRRLECFAALAARAPVSRGALAVAAGVTPHVAGVWLRLNMRSGYVRRHGVGRYVLTPAGAERLAKLRAKSVAPPSSTTPLSPQPPLDGGVASFVLLTGLAAEPASLHWTAALGIFGLGVLVGWLVPRWLQARRAAHQLAAREALYTAPEHVDMRRIEFELSCDGDPELNGKRAPRVGRRSP